MTILGERNRVLQETREREGNLPPRVAPEMKVLYKREGYTDYEEWRIEYSVENADTFPLPQGWNIPAYLLVPTSPKFSPPFPAMIAYHQCGHDCAIGKEAIVGKRVDRPDQAYGLELVQQGFVVLAPDAICCGERRIMPWVRPRHGYGDSARRECWMKGQLSTLNPLRAEHGGLSCLNKYIVDGLQAMDLLQSLPFVDPERIGVIGHSLGAAQALTHMIHDPRVKAGISSPGGGAPDRDGIVCLAPRLFMGQLGVSDRDAKGLAKAIESFPAKQAIYAEAGAPYNLVQVVEPGCAHYFGDNFKRQAYARLKEYFGIAIKTERLLLQDILRYIDGRPTYLLDMSGKHAVIDLSGAHYVRAHRETMIEALQIILAVLDAKIPGHDREFRDAEKPHVRTESSADKALVTASIPAQYANVQTQCDYAMRTALQYLYENSASLSIEMREDKCEYIISLESCD